MKFNIDLKSAVCGLGVGVLVLLAVGAGAPSDKETGRFQISAGDNYTAYVVDTKTGQVWRNDQKDFRNAKLPE